MADSALYIYVDIIAEFVIVYVSNFKSQMEQTLVTDQRWLPPFTGTFLGSRNY